MRKFSGIMTFALGIAGLTLCSVSIWYTIDLLRTLGHDEPEKWLMTVTAIGFEACKFAFIPIAFALLSHRKALQGSMVFFLGLALVCVSMVASLGFLAAKTDKGVEIARIESDEYKIGQARLKTIDQSIEMLSSAAAIDSTSKWRKARENASQKALEIEALDQKRSQIIESMKTIDATSKTDTGALFIALAKGWKMKAEDAKKLCYIVVALLLELCAIAALSLAGIGALKTSEKATTPEKVPFNHRKRSSPSRFSNLFSRSTDLVKNASAASTEATCASVEAAPKIRSTSEKRQKSKAHNITNSGILSDKGALVYDLTQYSEERKRAGQELQAAHSAKIEALKAHKNLARECQELSAQTNQLRKRVEDQKALLNNTTEQQAKSVAEVMTKKQTSRKRSSKESTPAKISFDQDLFSRMQHEITTGQVKGSIRSIQANYKIGFSKAQMYHTRLKQLGDIKELSKKSVTQA